MNVRFLALADQEVDETVAWYGRHSGKRSREGRFTTAASPLFNRREMVDAGFFVFEFLAGTLNS